MLALKPGKRPDEVSVFEWLWGMDIFFGEFPMLKGFVALNVLMWFLLRVTRR